MVWFYLTGERFATGIFNANGSGHGNRARPFSKVSPIDNFTSYPSPGVLQGIMAQPDIIDSAKGYSGC
jgi:hypothetical protein